MWTDVKYEPGELHVVAYNADGSVMGEQTVRTAGSPHHLVLSTDSHSLPADGESLAYVTVSVVDKDGNLCPDATPLVNFSVKGAGRFRAAANGDPTCLDLFQQPCHHAFAGQLTAIVQANPKSGQLRITAKARGLKSATLSLEVK